MDILHFAFMNSTFGGTNHFFAVTIFFIDTRLRAIAAEAVAAKMH